MAVDFREWRPGDLIVFREDSDFFRRTRLRRCRLTYVATDERDDEVRRLILEGGYWAYPEEAETLIREPEKFAGATDRHTIVLRNGRKLIVQEVSDGIHIADEDDGEIDRYICSLTKGGVLVMPNSGGALEWLLETSPKKK